MKITKLETLCLSRPHEPQRQWITARYRTIKADCAIVVIHTDEGVTGIGAGKQQNLEAALQVEAAGKPGPKKAKAAAAALICGHGRRRRTTRGQI